MKLFRKIFEGRLAAQELLKLQEDIMATSPTEHKDPMAMLLSFEIYCQVICAWVPPTTILDLHCALADYRLQLHELVSIYIFQSVRDLHFAFVQTRMFKGQDDPHGWREPLTRFFHKLRRIESATKATVAPYKPGKLGGSASGALAAWTHLSRELRICHKYNNYDCDGRRGRNHLCYSCHMPGHDRRQCPLGRVTGATMG